MINFDGMSKSSAVILNFAK